MVKVTKSKTNLKIEFTLPHSEFSKFLDALSTECRGGTKLDDVLGELEAYEDKLNKSKKRVKEGE